MTLARIAQLLSTQGLLDRVSNMDDATAQTRVTGADCDSRFAAPNHLFVCKGAAFKPAYLASALESGCVAYMCDGARADELAAMAPGVPQLVASDLRRAMAVASAAAWDHPDRSIDVVGITGTKGKSTVSYMLKQILDAGSAEPRAAILGSIETFDGVEHFESVNTTPESPDLWRHVRNAADSCLPYLVMEVSSQALKYDRVVDLGLDVACFLNIGRDHISPVEHPNFADYFGSKLRIFDQARVAVVNLDTDELDTVLEHARHCERVVTFGCSDAARKAGADVWATDVRPFQGGITFACHTPGWEGDVTVSMPGLFNVDNACAAIAMCEVLGVGRDQVVAGLSHVRVPGRMELLLTDDPKVTAIVDYAHNKLSYQRFFSSIVKEFAGRDVIAVFGAPGGKAYERRQELPQEASKWADYLIYTEEDPAHDSVADICQQMSDATPAGQPHEVILERPAAIERAVELAFSSDRGAVVCLLAKGDETRQHEGDRFVPCEPDGEIFRRAVKNALARRASAADGEAAANGGAVARDSADK